MGLGILISFLGLIVYLWEAMRFNDFTRAFQEGNGYLFLISGLVMIVAYILISRSEQRLEEDK